MAVVAVAPCQWRTPGGVQITSPGRTVSTGPPSACTQPQPLSTTSIWPSGWVCQLVRAPGSKVTQAPVEFAGALPRRRGRSGPRR